jgi:hypothetical protein
VVASATVTNGRTQQLLSGAPPSIVPLSAVDGARSSHSASATSRKHAPARHGPQKGR